MDGGTKWWFAAGLAIGALGGYVAGSAVAFREGSAASTAAYRKGLQEGHNRLAARVGRKEREGRRHARKHGGRAPA